MANVVIVGMQWGDEGKGKVVDLLSPAFDVAVRYQGGHNAGHTVKFGDRHFALHLIPSGIVHPRLQCVLGNGMVIAPDAFFTELEALHAAGVDPTGRLHISSRAPVLMPLHAALDQAREAARGEKAIGTTSRGIGPAYESKAARFGLRTGDLAAPDLEDRLAVLLERLGACFSGLDKEALPTLEELVAQCRTWSEQLAPYLADTAPLLNGWIAGGKRLLFEGAQGTLLDVDHGTYPFVTSSNTTAGAAATGSGVPPTSLGGVIGILKAYTTRVGAGPFPSELSGEAGEAVRQRGNEYGTTTGRPRRCGWLDLVVARYGRMLSGVDAIALTKLDVLDELDEIPVCVAYRIGGREVTDFPASLAELEAAEPVLETLPGWGQSTVGTTDFDGLPTAAQDYVRFLEERTGAPVLLVSTGPRREETVIRTDLPVAEALLGGRVEEVLAARGS